MAVEPPASALSLIRMRIVRARTPRSPERKPKTRNRTTHVLHDIRVRCGCCSGISPRGHSTPFGLATRRGEDRK